MRIVSVLVTFLMVVTPLSSWGTVFSHCESETAPVELAAGGADGGHHTHHTDSNGGEHPLPRGDQDEACSDCSTLCDCSAGCSLTAIVLPILGYSFTTRGDQQPGQDSFYAGPEPQALFRPPIQF